MINNLEKENIIAEVKGLVNCIEDAKDEVNIYCDLVKQLFLSESTQN